MSGSRGRAASVLPAVTLALRCAALLGQVLRDGIEQAERQPFALTVRARGASDTRLVLRHTLRHGATGALTLSGYLVGSLLGGAVLVETVFARPGLGRVTLTAIADRDLPVVAGVIMLSAVVFVIVNLVVDSPTRCSILACGCARSPAFRATPWRVPHDGVPERRGEPSAVTRRCRGGVTRPRRRGGDGHRPGSCSPRGIRSRPNSRAALVPPARSISSARIRAAATSTRASCTARALARDRPGWQPRSPHRRRSSRRAGRARAAASSTPRPGATDILLAFPEFLVALVVVAILGPGPVNGRRRGHDRGHPRYLRLARARTRTLRQAEHVEAARILGSPAARRSPATSARRRRRR